MSLFKPDSQRLQTSAAQHTCRSMMPHMRFVIVYLCDCLLCDCLLCDCLLDADEHRNPDHSQNQILLVKVLCKFELS